MRVIVGLLLVAAGIFFGTLQLLYSRGCELPWWFSLSLVWAGAAILFTRTIIELGKLALRFKK